MRILIIIMFIATLIFCTPAIRTTVFQIYEPRPANHPIKIFRHKMPKCEFEEIGIVNSRQRNKLIPNG